MKSKRSWLIVITIYAILLVIVRMASGMLSSERPRTGPDTPLGCSDEVVARVNNGSRDRVASILERDCGATTDFVRSVYLVSPSDKDLSSYGKPVAVANGQGIASLNWHNNRTLIVHYDPDETKFFQQEASTGEVQIAYRPEARTKRAR